MQRHKLYLPFVLCLSRSITIEGPGVGSTTLTLPDIRTKFKPHTFCSVLQWWVLLCCAALCCAVLRCAVLALHGQALMS